VVSERGGEGERQRRQQRPNGGAVAITEERQETQQYDTQRSLLNQKADPELTRIKKRAPKH
jgi:hypothetical protein